MVVLLCRNGMKLLLMMLVLWKNEAIPDKNILMNYHIHVAVSIHKKG